MGGGPIGPPSGGAAPTCSSSTTPPPQMSHVATGPLAAITSQSFARARRSGTQLLQAQAEMLSHREVLMPPPGRSVRAGGEPLFLRDSRAVAVLVDEVAWLLAPIPRSC